MDDKNQVIATHTAAELKQKKAHNAGHIRSESALSTQSSTSCNSMMSNNGPDAGEVVSNAGIGPVMMSNNTVMYPYMVPYPISMCCVPGTESSSVDMNNTMLYSTYYPPGAYQTMPQMMLLPPMDAQTYQQYMSSMGLVMSGVLPPENMVNASDGSSVASPPHMANAVSAQMLNAMSPQMVNTVPPMEMMGNASQVERMDITPQNGVSSATNDVSTNSPSN